MGLERVKAVQKKFEEDKPKLMRLFIEEKVYGVIFECLHKKEKLEDKALTMKDLDEVKISLIVDSIENLIK